MPLFGVQNGIYNNTVYGNNGIHPENRGHNIPKIANVFPGETEKYEYKNQNEDRLKVLSVIYDDKDCPKDVNKEKMAETIIKVAAEFDMDPVVLACIIRKETNFRQINGANGQGLMQLTRISIEDMFLRPKVYDKKLEEIKKKYPTAEALYKAIQKDPELNMRVGVILFKTKSKAVKNNLSKALENYNGHPKYKKSYSRIIMNMIKEYDNAA